MPQDPKAVKALLGSAPGAPLDEAVTDELPDPEPPDVDDGPADEFAEMPGGRMRMRSGGELWVLRRPNFGELRDFVDAWEADVIGRFLGADAPDKDAGEMEKMEAVTVHLQDAINKLETRGKKAPALDDMPAWAGRASTVRRMMAHWQADPTPPGR